MKRLVGGGSGGVEGLGKDESVTGAGPEILLGLALDGSTFGWSEVLVVGLGVTDAFLFGLLGADKCRPLSSEVDLTGGSGSVSSFILDFGLFKLAAGCGSSPLPLSLVPRSFLFVPVPADRLGIVDKTQSSSKGVET